MSITKLDRLRKEMDTAIASEDFQLAFQVVNDMLDIDPKNDQFWNSKGVILSKLERIEESLESFDKGLMINPEEQRIWYSKGCVLMDSGEFRMALACLYKCLDLDPAYEKGRDRFLRCLDEWVEAGGNKETRISEDRDEDLPHDEVEEEIEMEWSEEKKVLINEDEDESDVISVTRSREIIKQREMKGTFLDDDLFSDEEAQGEAKDESWDEEEDESEEGDEEWSEEEIEGWEENDDQPDDDHEDQKEGDEDEVETDDEADDWSEEEIEGWDDSAQEGVPEDEPVPEIKKTIRCKCGEDIPIFSDDRPYRFECPSCKRTGTLKR